MVGKPVIRGTRIPVERILGHLAHNPDLDGLFGAYPELTVEDVKTALASAQAAIERGPSRRRRPVRYLWNGITRASTTT